MRKKEMMSVAAFSSTTDAMTVEAKAKEEGMPGRLISLPSAISAGCGFAWAVPVLFHDELISFLESRNLRYESITDLML